MRYKINRVGILWRFDYSKAKDMPTLMPGLPYIAQKIVFPFVGKRWRDAAYGQGMGRHTKDEVIEMGLQDLRAMSHFLGKWNRLTQRFN